MGVIVSSDERREMLTRGFAGCDRQAFVAELVDHTMLRPTERQIRQYYAKRPNAWIDGLATLAKLAGFTDRTESMNVHLVANLSALSDVELAAKLSELSTQLGMISTQNDGAIVDAQCTDTTVSVVNNTSAHAPIAQPTEQVVRKRIKRKS